MNEIEDRIYHEAEKVAAEVTAADVPPLRLAGRPRRHGLAGQPATVWSGAGHGSVARRILAPLAAAACIAALIIGLVVTGNGPAHRAHPPLVSVKKHVALDRRLGAEALDWYFPASGATYTDGLAFAWTREKIGARDIDPCLAAAGFPQPPFTGSQSLYQRSFADLSQFPNLNQLLRYQAQQLFLKQSPVVHNPTAARMKAFRRAQARCTAEFAGPVTRVDKAASGLQTSWLNIITAIQSSPAVSATQPTFARCLEAHGVPANLATMTSHSSNPLFYGYFAWADGTNQTASSNKQLAIDERREIRVFVACAPSVVSVVNRLQLARRAQFFREHAQQIKRIVELAEAIGLQRGVIAR